MVALREWTEEVWGREKGQGPGEHRKGRENGPGIFREGREPWAGEGTKRGKRTVGA